MPGYHTSKSTGDQLVISYGGTNTSTAFGNVADNNWHFGVVTHDSSTNTRLLYLDGKQVGSDSDAINTDTGTNFQLGRWTNSSNYFQGQLDDVKIFNYALTQVKDLYNGGAVNFGPSSGAP